MYPGVDPAPAGRQKRVGKERQASPVRHQHDGKITFRCDDATRICEMYDECNLGKTFLMF